MVKIFVDYLFSSSLIPHPSPPLLTSFPSCFFLFSFPLPPSLPLHHNSVSSEPLAPGHTTEYRESEKLYIWRMKKLEGGTEEQLVMKVNQLSKHNIHV